MSDAVEWLVEPGVTEYPAAVAFMEARAASIRTGTARELIWLVEHPSLYTAGTSADPTELLDARLPVFASGRGGRYTYHGPGQRVVYVMLDLDRRGRDIRRFVHALEHWIITALALLGVSAFPLADRVGVWVGPAGDPAKIAAVGVRVRRWVTLHGAAINVDPELARFDGIVPCGIADARVTSIVVERGATSGGEMDQALADAMDAFLAELSVSTVAMPLEERRDVG